MGPNRATACGVSCDARNSQSADSVCWQRCRERFGMGDDEPFLSRLCIPPKAKPYLQVAVSKSDSPGPGVPFGVAGVHAVDAEDAIDAAVRRGVKQDLADRTATGAPAAERNLAEVHVARRFCRGNQREKSRLDPEKAERTILSQRPPAHVQRPCGAAGSRQVPAASLLHGRKKAA